PEHRPAHLLRYGQDPKVVCLSRLANTLWFLGHAESAKRVRDAARVLADEVGHPYSRSISLVFAGMLALEMRDPDSLREYVAALRAGRTDHEARQNVIGREGLEGYLDVLDGRREAGIARIQRALADARGSAPAPGAYGMGVRVLLEACAAAGDARTGLAAADEALGV